MTLSYVWMTTALILVLEMLAMIGLSLLLFLVVVPFVSTLEAKQVAQHYALVASLRASTAALDPQSTFQTGQRGTLALPGQASSSGTDSVPYIATPASSTRILAVALLISPDGSILASSYPHRYPPHLASSSLLPGKGMFIRRALLGVEGSGQETTLAESSVFVVEPVWSRQVRPIGAIYVQFTNLPAARDILSLTGSWDRLFLIGALILFVALPPISGLFGRLTTRGLVRRIRQLVEATSRLADGDYTQRVSIGRQDEIGQLEHHFNRMALQLTESIQQQQALTEQNARLSERTRLSRDLHDSIKQQVFALATQIGAALSLCDHQPGETRIHLEIASELAYQVRQELTTLIQEWRPSPLGEQGFAQALRKELERWSRHNTISVDMQLHDVPQLPTATVGELLRVVQEALSNVARHSQATHVQVSLEQEREQIVLTIADNGRGFDRSAVSPQSMGLQSMQERLEGMNGTFQLQSSIGQGTHIEVRYPHYMHMIDDISDEEIHK
jgi:two-component system, NarL family, sensor histidine kinase LiaS